jgi:hypothetical protein
MTGGGVPFVDWSRLHILCWSGTLKRHMHIDIAKDRTRSLGLAVSVNCVSVHKPQGSMGATQANLRVATHGFCKALAKP